MLPALAALICVLGSAIKRKTHKCELVRLRLLSKRERHSISSIFSALALHISEVIAKMRENHFSKFLPRWCVRTNQRDGDGVAASWRWSKVEVELLKRKEKKTAKPAEIVGSVCLGGRSDVVATFRFKFASGVVCERRERVRKTVQTTARRVLARRGAACSCSVLS